MHKNNLIGMLNKLKNYSDKINSIAKYKDNAILSYTVVPSALIVLIYSYIKDKIISNNFIFFLI